MTDWESGLARLGLFAGVMPRAIGAVRNAGHGDPASGVPAAGCGARAVGETAIDEFFIAINSVIRDIPPLSEVEAAVARCAWVADEFVASNTAELNVAPGPPTILDRRRKVFGTTGFHHIDYRVTLSLPPSAAHADPYADGIA